MLSLLLILSIIGIVVGCIKENYSANYFALCVTSAALALLFGSVLITLICIYPYKVNERLEMYQEENIKIETKVKETVQAYMNYEQETYKSLVETAELETLLIKYPELNSNELVKSEIETYKENNNKIKELKEQQIHKSVFDFWIKFV